MLKNSASRRGGEQNALKNGIRSLVICVPLHLQVPWDTLPGWAVVGWLERRPGSWQRPRSPLALVCSLLLPLAVKGNTTCITREFEELKNRR